MQKLVIINNGNSIEKLCKFEEFIEYLTKLAIKYFKNINNKKLPKLIKEGLKNYLERMIDGPYDIDMEYLKYLVWKLLFSNFK